MPVQLNPFIDDNLGGNTLPLPLLLLGSLFYYSFIFAYFLCDLFVLLWFGLGLSFLLWDCKLLFTEGESAECFAMRVSMFSSSRYSMASCFRRCVISVLLEGVTAGHRLDLRQGKGRRNQDQMR